MRALMVAAVLVLGACGPRDILVAQADMPDGGRPMHDEPCTLDSECRPMDYCERSDCTAVSGRCRPRPLFCDGAASPVCGCNGVTYWNDCVRRAAGQSLSGDGECTAGATCGGGQGCPDPRASCNLLVDEASSCGRATVGRCWGLPRECPPGSPGGTFSPCSGGGMCVSSCDAIRSGQAHARCQ
ncbi:MAG: hypothetical protein K1X89_10130 [Myxococcaceae bacterium]|nr:hypothetical protein [Myxococcaceae bacterium]